MSFLIFTIFTLFFIVLWVFSRKSFGVRETGCMNELLNISCLLNYKTRIIKIALSYMGLRGLNELIYESICLKVSDVVA